MQTLQIEALKQELELMKIKIENMETSKNETEPIDATNEKYH